MSDIKALLIGIKNYKHNNDDLHDLLGADDDVQQMEGILRDFFKPKKIFKDASEFGGAPGQTYNWTKEAISTALDRLVEESEGCRIIVYFSGHGARLLVPEGKGEALEVILASDFLDRNDPDYDRKAGASASGDYLGYLCATHLREKLKAVKNPTLVEVILDCCHASGMAGRYDGPDHFCPNGLHVPWALWASATGGDHRIINGKYRSPFTDEFCKLVSALKGKVSRRDLHEAVQKQMQEYVRLSCCLQNNILLRRGTVFGPPLRADQVTEPY